MKPLLLLLVLFPVGAADEESALAQLRRGEVQSAAAALEAIVKETPQAANAWLGLALARLQLGSRDAAIEAVLHAKSRGKGLVREHALFDIARLMYDKSLARPRPGAPPEGGMPNPELVADARSRLAVVRTELELAQAALLELLEARRDDGEARAALARTTAELRAVLELDAKWRAALVPPKTDGSKSGGSDNPGTLKPGPAGERSSSGVPEKKSGGSSEPGSGTPDDPNATTTAPFAGRPLDADERRKFSDLLDRVHADMERADERRADAAADRAGRSW